MNLTLKNEILEEVMRIGIQSIGNDRASKIQLYCEFEIGNLRLEIPAPQVGQSLVELLIAIGLTSILLPTFILSVVSSREGKAQQNQRIDAVVIMKSTEEIVRSVRNQGWSGFAVNGTFHPVQSGTKWALAAGADTVNGLARSVVISDVNRDTTGQIATSGGTLDPSTKQATVTLSWNTPLTTSMTSVMYLSRYMNNFATTQTLTGDFSQQTVTINTQADWCVPSLSISSLDLPGQGITTAISADTTNSFDYAYTTSGGNASGDSMDSVMITHTATPSATNNGIYDSYKTYGIYADTLNQYVYLTSDHPGVTVDIVQVANKPYTSVGTFNASGGGAGNSVYEGYNSSFGSDVGYVTVGSSLHTFNLSLKTGTRPQLDTASLPGTGKKVIVVGNYAYVAVASTTEQMDIFDISNPNNITLISKINVQNNQQGVDLFVNSTGTRAYLVTRQASTPTNDFFIIDTTNKITTLPTPLGAFNTGTMNPTGVVVVPGFRAIVVGSGGEQYKVLNIASESSPSRCGGLTNPNGASAINAVGSLIRSDGSEFSYILTNDSSTEFQMIQGGPGNQTIIGTQVVTTDGSSIPNDGQIQLGTGGISSWCSPTQNIVSTANLPKTANSILTTSSATYVGLGDGTNGATFSKLSISDPYPPPGTPSASLISTYTSSTKTNSIYTDGAYGYLATDGASNQIIILSISASPYSQIGTISLPSGTSANGIFVVNNTAYITSNNTVYSYDISTKTGSHTTPLGQISLWAGTGSTPVAKQIVVVNGYMYVAATNTVYGLQKFKILTGSTQFQLVGVSNLSWSQDATGIYISPAGLRAYISFTNGAGGYANGFYIVDTSPSDPPSWWTLPNYYTVVGIYNSGSTIPKGITAVPEKAILVGANGTYQYHAVDISVETNPQFCGGMVIANGITGVSSLIENDGDAYSYITTGEAQNQFKIIQGGSGVNQNNTSGVFESHTIDLGYSGVFNSFTSHVSQPPLTSIKMQLAPTVSISGTCNNATFTYLGPDGTPNTYFTPVNSVISGPVPAIISSPTYSNPGQCFRYKVWLSTTDFTQTPVFYDFTVNASP